MMRSLSWAPTIALSWLWGLGFFYSIDVVLSHGWLGFLCFAAPNAIGLALFGWILGAKPGGATKAMARLGPSHTALFLLCQLFAVAVTLFALFSYALEPVAQESAATYAGVTLLAACAIGYNADIKQIKGFHSKLLMIGLAGVACAAWGLAGHTFAAPISHLDPRFLGLLPAMLVGFLLGPWTDLQHWARAAAIEREGGSVRAAYLSGGVLFLALITVNAGLAAWVGSPTFTTTADGLPGAYSSVVASLAKLDSRIPLYGFLLWTVISAVSTIDSSCSALRAHFAPRVAKSSSALLAFIPEGVASSPLWVMGAAVLLAVVAVHQNLSLIYLMAPFATLLAGPAASLLLSTLGYEGRQESVFSFLVCGAAGLILYDGYVTGSATLEALAPFVALIGALPTLRTPAAPLSVAAEGEAVDNRPVLIAPTANASRMPAGGFFGFENGWFVCSMVPTYDDTNSVGNVYFANYVRWVGKARELFFDECMPDFDLKTTEFLVLTRSFHHDFRREAREFEPVLVRIRIGGHNRKFVTLRHEIVSLKHGLLGSGEQSLMFVDKTDFRPLDIPRSIVQGFAAHWPKESPHVTLRPSERPRSAVGA